MGNAKKKKRLILNIKLNFELELNSDLLKKNMKFIRKYYKVNTT